MNPSVELVDVFDQFGNLTGRAIPRGNPLAVGEYQLAVHVWVRCGDGAYLVQQRALSLPKAPGIWATTSGLAITGEDSLSAAVRELSEELGLDLPKSSFALAARLRTRDQFEDIWVAIVDREGIQPVVGAEVAAWRWAAGRELLAAVSAGVFYPYNYLEELLEGCMPAHPDAVRLTPFAGGVGPA